MGMLLLYFGSSFVLHLLWENIQMPLYQGNLPFLEHFPICLWATATGDMFFMGVIYLIVATVHRNVWWVQDLEAYAHPATWLLPIVIGALLAVSFELWAVYVAHRFAYGSMPLIPIVQVGLTPVLQMIVVPLVTLALTQAVAPRARGR